jgi:predicted site-specific integrase-resolvase
MENVNTNTENLINEVEASKILGIASETLRIGYRYKGLVPYVRLKNNCIRYRPSDLRKFVENRLVKATK